MSVESEITRLYTAKADLKTSIEDKGVTVPSSTKLDGYADLVDNISGGSSVPYIINPLNGADFGAANKIGGTYQHQYQVSDGEITDAYFLCDNFTASSVSLPIYPNQLTFLNSSYYNSGAELVITSAGLMSLSLPSASSNWLKEYEGNIIVVLTIDNDITLLDKLRPYCRWACFIKDTLISLSNKEFKKIQDVSFNDELLVWNFDEGKYDSAKPLWIKKVQTTTWYYRLAFSDGTVLKVTGDYPKAHSLYSVDDGEFIHCNELVGKKVYTLSGIQTLEKCEEVSEEVEFYNIITNYHMNLFANGVLTSTSLNNLYPIKDMVFVKEDREPAFDYSKFDRKWVNGLRLEEQPKDITDYCNNLIRLQLKK